MTADKPHHVGHRDRLRARFAKGEDEALADYELLELLLFTAIPRRDVKPIAKDLINKCGSLHKVLTANINDLTTVAGISEGTATFLKATHALHLRAMRQELTGKTILDSWDKLLAYCHAAMAEDDIERFRILYLNRKNQLIADEIHASGTVDAANIYTREVLKKAMNLGATALILVHNHPSGDPAPSKADLDMTFAIIEAAKPLGIIIHDHLIIARSGHSSLRSMGLLA